MSQSELKRMAGEFRRLAQLEGNSPVLCSRMHFAEWADVLDREHPADDSIAVAEEWLRAAGWEQTREGGPHWYLRGGAGVLWDRRENELMIGNGTTGWHLVAKPATRGDVRALLRGLKVPAKEGG